MNPRILSQATRLWFCLGVLLCASVTASADTQLTFQVDMTGKGLYTAVYAAGTFNGWGTFTLTNNPNAANPNLYSGTVDDTTDANGAVLQYKFVDVLNGTNNYETTSDGDNRCAQLPTNSGASLALPYAYFSDGGPITDNNVTFQVDMSEQIVTGAFTPASGGYVEVRGSFTGWAGGTTTLTNIPTILTTNSAGIVSSNVYVGTFDVTGSPGAAEEYKYVIQPGTGWENPTSADDDSNSGNRFFANVTETLPIVYFSDQPLSETVTNLVTFQVDMSAEVLSGGFSVANGQYVTLAGNFNGWSTGAWVMTNNPAAQNTNIYAFITNFVGGLGAQYQYKYVIQPQTDWESPVSTAGGNRVFNQLTANGPEVLPVVFWNDLGVDDYVTTNTLVTFSVNMSNAVNFTTGAPFSAANGDIVYINGDFLGWLGWNVVDLAPYQMTNNGSSQIYSLTLPIPAGNPLLITYKYSIGGQDDEAASGDNHQRYVRSVGSVGYIMPTDFFGSQGGKTAAEPSYANLTIKRTSATTAAVSWLGRPGVHLQSTGALLGPTGSQTVWTSQYATDGTNLIVAPGGTATTNLTIGKTNLFLQLIKQ